MRWITPGLAALCVCLISICAWPQNDPPNILFILADDQRADTIGRYGNPDIQTPNLDGLVDRGFSFRRAYCMGSTGGAVCVPSRAMIMSGRTLYRAPTDLNGVRTLPQVFRERGFTTFATGKWHNRAESLLRSFERGEAVFLGGMSNHENVPLRDITDSGELSGQRRGAKFSSELFADAAVDFLANYDDAKPFFAYVSFTAPHDPRMPPEAYRETYYAKDLAPPPNFLPQHPFDNAWMVGRDEDLAAWPRTREIVSDQLAEYYGMITHMDEQIGRILGTLAASPHARNTIIVYAADHGLAMGSHGLLGKQSVYEHSVKAPLIFAGPGIPRGQSSDALAYLFDIYPTLCDIAGLPTPRAVEGQSLRPVWEGEANAIRDSIFLAYEGGQRSVCDERWKLIRYPHINHTQLFDLQNDPHEMRSLAEEAEYASRVEELTRLLRDWQARVGDDVPLVSPRPRDKDIDLTGFPRTPDSAQPDWIVEKYFE